MDRLVDTAVESRHRSTATRTTPQPLPACGLGPVFRNDQIDQLANVAQHPYFGGRKADTEFLLDTEDKAYVADAVPPLDVVCGCTILEGNGFVEYVLKNLVQTIKCFATQ